MKKLILLVMAIALFSGCSYQILRKEKNKSVKEDNTINKLNKCSFLVKAGDGGGSAFLISRKRGDDTIHFAWTAAHVLAEATKITEVIGKDGRSTYTVKYDDVTLIRDIVNDGRKVGGLSYYAKVLRTSDSYTGEDIALLQLRKKNIFSDGIKFYNKKEIPRVGLPVWHVGCILGSVGANSLTDGLIASVGRVRLKKIYDQTSVTAWNGSSGCGLYLKPTGDCIGILLERVNAPNTLYYKPIREIRKWAIKNNCLWAIDEDIELPTDEEIESFPINLDPVEVPKKPLTIIAP